MKKEKYLSSIIPILKEEGLSLSMDAIAQRIGVTKKTLYNIFSSKDKMIEECLGLISDRFKKDLECMEDENVPVTGRFATGVTTLRLYFKDMSHAFIRDLMVQYPQMAEMDHTAGRSFFEEKVARNIECGQREGVYRSDIDPGLLSKYISFSIFSFFQKEVMLGSAYSADYYFKQVIDFNINALLNKQ